MVEVRDIREHMEVVGSDGGHVGTVDRIDSGQIKLTKNDLEPGNIHHYLDLETVDYVEGDQVHLNLTTSQAQAAWASESRAQT